MPKDGCVRIRKENIAFTYPFAQRTVYLRAVNADGIDLDTMFTDGIIVLLELSKLHAAEGSPVATIKKV